jgi:hypothetical protein
MSHHTEFRKPGFQKKETSFGSFFCAYDMQTRMRFELKHTRRLSIFSRLERNMQGL